MTATEPEGLTAVLLQLAGMTERLSALDHRQSGDIRQMTDRLTALKSLVTDLKGITASHAEALAALPALDAQLAGLTARVTGGATGDAGEHGYQPPPPPRLWKLTGPDRDRALGKLRGWVDQVYRPGYGHLSASLGECWDQHPLCLYILDWLSELWSVLYLAPARTAGTLAGQAEWHTRLLPAAADQLARESRGCAHTADRQRLGARP